MITIFGILSALFMQADDTPRIERDGVFVSFNAAGADVFVNKDDGEYTWRVECRIDAMSDDRKCSLLHGPVTAGDPYVSFLGAKSSGGLCVMEHDFPGRSATIRIDDMPAISAGPAGCIGLPGVIRALHAGKKWRSRRYTWPNDVPVDEELDLRGLSVALDILVQLHSSK